jgi:hypothetical protein
MNNLFRASALPWFLVSLLALSDCSGEHAVTDSKSRAEGTAITHTEVTSRLKNQFEYLPMHSGTPGQVRIQLTDLVDGSPVDQADVVVVVRRRGAGAAVAQATAKMGEEYGTYAAELNIPQAGEYDIEFQVKNADMDEHFPLSDLKVE